MIGDQLMGYYFDLGQKRLRIRVEILKSWEISTVKFYKTDLLAGNHYKEGVAFGF